MSQTLASTAAVDSTDPLAPLTALVAARVLMSPTPCTAADVARATRRFAPSTSSDPDWNAQVALALEGARAAHLIDGDPSVPLDGARVRVLHTMLELPATSTWAQLVDRWLPLRALGITAAMPKLAARVKDRDTWTSAIAARLLGQWTEGAPPSLAAVCDALAWERLGLAGKPKRCPREIRSLFLQRELATEAAPPDRLLRLYVARELGVPRAELKALRDSLVIWWLAGRAIGRASIGRSQSGSAIPAPAAVSLPPEAFAQAVQATARAATSGRFGPRKVFVSAIWEGLRDQPGMPDSLAALKARLLAAHRAGELELTRADLVAAMDPALVAASEIVADGATFHFVVRADIA